MDSIQLKKGDGGIKQYFAPASFEELTEKQYIGAVEIMGRMTAAPSDQWRIPLLLAGMNINEIAELNPAQRAQLLVNFSWLFDPEKLPMKEMIRKFSIADYTPWSFRQHLYAASTLYGPGDGLKYLTFGEFLACEQALDSYEASKKKGDGGFFLDMLCGILYRKSGSLRKKQADKRVTFEEGEKDTYAGIFTPLDPVIKTAILMNYHGMKRKFPDLYRNLFSKKKNSSENSQGKDKPSSLTWLNTVIQMADFDAIKVVDIERQSLHLVLKVLDEKIASNKKLKEEMERNRTRK